MNRRILAALFLAASALDAGAQRISLEVPLSPRPSIAGPAVAPLAQTFPLALTPWNPTLNAPAVLHPHNAVPIPSVNLRAPIQPLPLNLSGLPDSAIAAPMKLADIPFPFKRTLAEEPIRARQLAAVIDTLREYGARSQSLAGLKGEAGAAALERNFMSAAALGDEPLVPPVGDGAYVAPSADARPLLTRMLERVRLDDRGRADEKKALEESFKRLLETPTGRRYAEEFLAEGLTAVVRFDDFADSQLFLIDGRKRFYAAQAYTDWRPEGYAEIRLNRHYVDGDPEFMRESLPSIIGHELLGHGLWYGRATKENLYLAFHYHELNETLARLVGWAIDHELDGRFEEAGAWNYLADPAHYLSNLKMRLPYYAVTFGQSEMAKPLATLRARLASAEAEVMRARSNLASQKTWLPVLDHFSRDHGIPAGRFGLLRKELSDLEAHYQNEVVNAESIVREVSGLIERIAAEPDRASELYLKEASAHPFFERLSADTARLGKALETMANAAPPAPPRPAPPRPADQITWEALAKMYQEDVAADANRAFKHWR
ncbi:MAG: hypothetical protein Q8T11_05720 [Elusimicrobiota bacterium]|nr:hypothetical protein [Elusimicrobiota bacterium]